MLVLSVVCLPGGSSLLLVGPLPVLLLPFPTNPHSLQLPTPLNLGHLVLKFCVWVFGLLSQALVFTDVNFLSLQCAVLSKVPLSFTAVVRIQYHTVPHRSHN